MPVEKVLFFDSWTAGWNHFQFLSQLYRQRGIRHLLVHTESVVRGGLPPDMRGVLTQSAHCFKDGLECRDISLYNSDVLTCLTEERPDVVVMINQAHLVHRVMTRACQRIGIPVVFMMHGALLPPDRVGEYIDDFKRRTRFMLGYKLRKVRKFWWLFRQYRRVSGSTMEASALMASFVSKPIEFSWRPRAHRSLDIDLALVFTEEDRRTVRALRHVPDDRIVVTGNPKLDALISFRPSVTFDSIADISGITGPYLLLIDQALVESLLMSASAQTQLVRWLESVARDLGLALITKLHPRSAEARYRTYVGEVSPFLKNEVPLHDLIHHAEAVIGHYSTALIEALALRRPVLTMNWFSGVLGTGIFPPESTACVRHQRDFPAKLARMLETGWDQEELRSRYFPNRDQKAADLIAHHVHLAREAHLQRSSAASRVPSYTHVR